MDTALILDSNTISTQRIADRINRSYKLSIEDALVTFTF